MTIYCVQTLVDISDPGNLNKTFPFTTESGHLVHDKETLVLAKNQKQWVKHILDLKDDKLKFNKFSEEAYNKVLKKYSYESWHKFFLSTIINESKN